MSAAFAKDRGGRITHVRAAHTEPVLRGIANYLAPLLSGFAVGAGLGILLWHLF
jgi:hypothetical protein